ncbi:MAG: right-handed parallel beta-helix repeat-containing protein [Bacteroidota bacterium]
MTRPPHLLPLALLAALTFTPAASGQDCPVGTTPLGVGCLVEEQGDPPGEAPLAQARLARATTPATDSVSVPYTTTYAEFEGPDPTGGSPDRPILFWVTALVEWEHRPGTPYYSLVGTAFDGTEVSRGGTFGYGTRERRRVLSGTPIDTLLAAPGNLIGTPLGILTGLRDCTRISNSNDRADCEADNEASRNSLRADLVTAFEGFSHVLSAATAPAPLVSSTGFDRGSVEAGVEFEVLVEVTNPYVSWALDVGPAEPIEFFDADGNAASVDVLSTPTPVDTLFGGETATLRYRAVTDEGGLLSAAVLVGGTKTRYYREPVEASVGCSFDASGRTAGASGRRDDPSCTLDVEDGEAIVVNQDGTESDADTADGICDVDPGTAGEQCTLQAALETVAVSDDVKRVVFDVGRATAPTVPVPEGVRIDGAGGSANIVRIESLEGGTLEMTEGSSLQTAILENVRLVVRGPDVRLTAFGVGDSGIGDETIVDGTSIEVRPEAENVRITGCTVDYADLGIVIEARDAQVRECIVQPAGTGTGEAGIEIIGRRAFVFESDIAGARGANILIRAAADSALVMGSTIRDGRDAITVEDEAFVNIGGITDAGEVRGNEIRGNRRFGVLVGSTPARQPGVSESTEKGILLVGNTISDSHTLAVNAEGVSGSVFIGDDVEAFGTDVGNRLAAGVVISTSRNVSIRGNTIQAAFGGGTTNALSAIGGEVFIEGNTIDAAGSVSPSGASLPEELALVYAFGDSVAVYENRLGMTAGAVVGLNVLSRPGGRIEVENNWIVDNAEAGLLLSTGGLATVRGNVVQDNGEYGVWAYDGGAVIIGGQRTSVAPGCEASCNQIFGHDIDVFIDETNSAVILGNNIGGDSSDSSGQKEGVRVRANNVVIGGDSGVATGTCDGACNRIVRQAAGVRIVEGPGWRNVQVQGNAIQATTFGVAAVDAIGASVGAAFGEQIRRSGNWIQAPTGVAVLRASLGPDEAVGNTVRGNRIDATIYPITLGNGGRTIGSNDPNDADTGANLGLNHPTIIQARQVSDQLGEVLVLWTGERIATTEPYTLDLYTSDACNLGPASRLSLLLDARDFQFPLTVLPHDTVRVRIPYFGSGTAYVGTFTDSAGNTSEAGNCVRANSDGDPGYVLVGSNTPTEIKDLRFSIQFPTGRTAGASARGSGGDIGVWVTPFTTPDDAPDFETFEQGTSATAPNGATVRARAFAGPAWRMASTDMDTSAFFRACLPTAGVDPGDGELLVAARGPGVGPVWRPLDTVAETIDGTDVVCASGPKNGSEVALAVGTAQGVSSEPGSDVPEAAPAELAVTAYPNPTRGAGTVRVEQPTAGPLRVTVLDALGRAVATLADGLRQPGVHTLALDASRLAPGVYAVVAEAGPERRVRTITVVR